MTTRMRNTPTSPRPVARDGWPSDDAEFAEMLLKHMRVIAARGLPMSRQPGRNHLPSLLRSISPEFDPIGHRTLQALTRLIDSGRVIVEQVGPRSDRSERLRVVA